MTRPKTSDLTRRERQIMDAVYTLGTASAAEVRGALPDPLSDSAVRTFLRILTEKGHLRQERDGARYVYHPVLPRECAAKSMLSKVVNTFFGGSVEQVVATLLSSGDTRISQEEFDRISTLVEKARKEELG